MTVVTVSVLQYGLLFLPIVMVWQEIIILAEISLAASPLG